MPKLLKTLSPARGDLVRTRSSISFTDGRTITNISTECVGLVVQAGLTEDLALFSGQLTWWDPGELEVISHAH